MSHPRGLRFGAPDTIRAQQASPTGERQARRVSGARVPALARVDGAPDTIRTYDLGFRKRSRPRGVVISYRTVTIGVFERRSAFRRALRFARYQRVTINAFD